jgi:S-adenosylmethionine decarboxylase
MFGPHLILEAYGCSKEKISNLTLISETLDAYPEKLHMTKIMPPYVFKYSGAVPEDWGVSGIVLIAESHISIHTFPDKEFVTLDIFSCKDFNVDEAVKYFCSVFKPKRYEKQLLMRGREFPRSPARAGHIVERERLKLAASS